MKYYVLEGLVRGQPIKGKMFASRPAAERAMEVILYREDLQVEEDRFISKHVEEFVCDRSSRFSISRVVYGR